MQRSNKISDVYAESSMSFPQKLYALMSREDGSVVKWASHGFAFIVCNQDKFVDEIIPKYFKHTKLTSFQRQLNLYGFRRLAKGENNGAYFHPNFQRGHKEMITEIKRLPAKSALPSLEDVMNAHRQLPAIRFNGIKKKPTQQETPAPVKKPPPVAYVDPPGVRRAARLKKHPAESASGIRDKDTFPDVKDAATVQPETAVAAVAAVASPISKSKITSNIGYTQQPAVFTKPVSVSPFRSSQSSSLPRLSINVEEPPPGKCDYLYMQLGSPLFSSRDLLMDTADTPHTAHTAHTAPVATAAAAVQVYPSDYDCLTVSEPHLMVPTYGNMHRKSSDNSLGATPMYHSGQPTGAVDYGISMGIGMGMGQDIAAAVTNSVSSERWVPHHADAIDDLLDFLGPLPGAQDLLFHCEDDEEEELDSSGGADGNRPAATATGEGTRMCAARETTITG